MGGERDERKRKVPSQERGSLHASYANNQGTLTVGLDIDNRGRKVQRQEKIKKRGGERDNTM